MKKLTAFVLSAMMVLSLAACGAKTETPADTSTPAADATKPAEVAKLTYAVEAGSAGEAALQENNLTSAYTAVSTQADALLEVASGASDACVIDITMAVAMTGEGTNYADLTYGLELTSEEYGIGFRKGSSAVAAVDEIINQLIEEGTLQALAEKYDLSGALVANQ